MNLEEAGEVPVPAAVASWPDRTEVGALREIRYGIVEDNEDYRTTLVKFLGAAGGFRCLFQEACAEEALYDKGAGQPDVILMDLELPGMCGIECIRQLKRLFPHIQFMAITNFDDPQRVFEAIRVGATGYVVKRELFPRIMECIREVAAGGAPMSAHIARMVLQAFYDPSPGPAKALSQRERQVLDLAHKGFRYADIAAELDISRDTVRTHFNNIYHKLQVHSKAEAIAKTRWRSNSESRKT